MLFLAVERVEERREGGRVGDRRFAHEALADVGGGCPVALRAIAQQRIHEAHMRAGVTLVDPGAVPHPDAASTDISKVIRADYGTDDFYTDLMERAFEGVYAVHKKRKVDMRTAAYLVAVGRVAEAHHLRGLYP